jgi:membrane-associated protein
MLDALLAGIAAWPVPTVLAVAAALLIAESGTLPGMVLPGSTLLVGLGIWAQFAPDRLAPAVVVAATATVTGAHLGWWRADTGRLFPHRAAAARRWLAGRTPVATGLLLAVGHWAAAARPVLPRVAGGAGVGYRIVGPALILSGTAWAAALVLLGHAIGPVVVTHAGWVPVVLVSLLIVGLVRHGRARARERVVPPD